jgi:hypothetical protein
MTDLSREWSDGDFEPRDYATSASGVEPVTPAAAIRPTEPRAEKGIEPLRWRSYA